MPCRSRIFLPRFGACLASLLCASASLHAQAVPPAPATAASPKKDADVLAMSPFTVATEKDDGYMAADVISGGMLATNLLKTPTDTTVITRAFLDDLGVSNMQEAQLWLTSSDISGSSDLATNPTDFGFGASFRGLAATPNSRNFFRQGYTPEEYVVDRIEGSRGPNGILYGDALQGGKSNFITKRATFNRSFTTVRLRMEGYDVGGTAAGYIDVNRKLNDKLAARVNAQFKRGDQWYENSYDDHQGIALTATYRPWRGAEIRGEMEQNFIRTSNFRPDLIDTLSSWDQTTTVSAALAANPATSTGLTRLTASGNAPAYYVYSPATGVQNWLNFGRTAGSNLTMFPNDAVNNGRKDIARFPVIPYRRFNLNDYNDRNEGHTLNYNLALEQRWDSGLVAEVAGDYNVKVASGDTLYYRNTYIDVNRFLPTGATNPNFGKYFSEQPSGFNPIRTADYYSGARVAVAYPFKTDRFFGISQTFSAVAQYREHLTAYKSWGLYRDNGAMAPAGVLNGNLIIRRWVYWDQRGTDMAPPESTATDKYRWVFTRDRHTTEHLGSVQVNTVGSYFHDTLTFIGGVRRDAYHAANRDITLRDPVTADPTVATGIATDVSVNTTTAGVTYFPIKPIGAYVFTNHGFNPGLTNTPKIDGNGTYNLAKSKGTGAGLRFNLLEGRVVGSVGWYDSFETDKFTSVALTTVNGVWNAILAAGGPDKRLPQLGAIAAYSDSLSQRSSGWEGDLTANLTKGFRLSANIAFPETKQLQSLRDTKAYYNANLAEWQSFASRFTAVKNALDTFSNSISGFTDNRPLTGTYDYRANIFGNYTVQSGPLKGLSFGGGANIFGEQIIGNVTGKPFDFIFADKFYTLSASTSYTFKVRNQAIKAQLNVSNLLDYKEPIFRGNVGAGVATFNGVQYRNDYYFMAARKFTLTLTATF